MHLQDAVYGMSGLNCTAGAELDVKMKVKRAEGRVRVAPCVDL